MTARKTARPKRAAAAPPILALVQHALEDMKATNIRVIDVRGINDIADAMVVACGTSDRHVKSIADNVVRKAKESGVRPYGVEGDREGEWVLVDLPDVLVHVMLPRVREHYALEQLWENATQVDVAPAAPKTRTTKPRTTKTRTTKPRTTKPRATQARSGAAKSAASAAGGARSVRKPADRRRKPTRH